MVDLVSLLGGPPAPTRLPARRPAAGGIPFDGEPPPFLVRRAEDSPRLLHQYRALRQQAFVEDQQLFQGHDLDDHDRHERTLVLVACDRAGAVLGGVRLYPAHEDSGLGWWRGGRLVCRGDGDRSGAARGEVGRALVLAACATAEQEGALRFDASVQEERERFFAGLGWQRVRPVIEAGRAHVLMRWPIERLGRAALESKAPLAALVGPLRPGGDGFAGDDAAPLPGTDVLVCTDAILPSIVERDPEWAGWCALLVNANDLAAMGATREGATNALAAPDSAHAARIMRGLSAGSRAFGLPLLGGHTQVGVPAALSVTALGRSAAPVRGGGGRPGDELTLTADLSGAWRPGYAGSQWDSTSTRTREEIDTMLDWVAQAQPRAAKDVSMAGICGTLGMLAEASGVGAELRVQDIPRPAGARLDEWITCFPGFAMLTCDRQGAELPPAAPARSARCGRLVAGQSVQLLWPDGERTTALTGPVTGIGPAGSHRVPAGT